MVVLAIFSIGFTSMAKHITSTGAFYGFISYTLTALLAVAACAVGLVRWGVSRRRPEHQDD